MAIKNPVFSRIDAELRGARPGQGQFATFRDRFEPRTFDVGTGVDH